jgi:hypothetical protein
VHCDLVPLGPSLRLARARPEHSCAETFDNESNARRITLIIVREFDGYAR